MRLIKKGHRNCLLVWLLATTIGLRALIAPGFMLDTSGDGPFGLTIVLCSGQNSAMQPDAIDDSHAVHTHHDSDTAQDATAGLAGKTCTLWSTSSTFVKTIAFGGDHLFTFGRESYTPAVRPLNAYISSQQQQQPRAPPVFPVI